MNSRITDRIEPCFTSYFCHCMIFKSKRFYCHFDPVQKWKLICRMALWRGRRKTTWFSRKDVKKFLWNRFRYSKLIEVKIGHLFNLLNFCRRLITDFTRQKDAKKLRKKAKKLKKSVGSEKIREIRNYWRTRSWKIRKQRKSWEERVVKMNCE